MAQLGGPAVVSQGAEGSKEGTGGQAQSERPSASTGNAKTLRLRAQGKRPLRGARRGHLQVASKVYIAVKQLACHGVVHTLQDCVKVRLRLSEGDEQQ